MKIVTNKAAKQAEERIAQLELKINSLADDEVARSRSKFYRASQSNFSSQSTVALDPNRRLDQLFGYPNQPQLQDYLSLYRRGIGNRVVETFPDECWKQNPRITDDTDAVNPTPFEAAIELVMEKTQFFKYAKRADILSMLNSYSVMVIGYNDDQAMDAGVRKDSESGSSFNLVEGWDQPIEASMLKGKTFDSNDPQDYPIIYCLPYVFGPNVFINNFYQNPAYYKFNKPQMYTVNTGTGFSQISGFDVIGQTGNLSAPLSTSTLPAVSMNVHESRIIHLAYDALQNDVFGKPLLETSYNGLLDLKRVMGSDAIIFEYSGRGGISIEADKDINIDADTKTQMRGSFEEYLSSTARILVLEGYTAKVLNFNHPNSKDSFEVQARRLSSLTKIPMRRLFGSERGELGGDNDEKNFQSDVYSRQTNYCTPQIIRPFIDKLIELEIIPPPLNNKYDVIWEKADSQTPADKASSFQAAATGLAQILNSAEGGMLSESAVETFNEITDGNLEIEKNADLNEDDGEADATTQSEQGSDTDDKS